MCPRYFLDMPGTIGSGDDTQTIAALRDIMLPRLVSGGYTKRRKLSGETVTSIMRSPKIWYWAVVVAMVIAAMAIASTVTGGPAILSAQTVEPSAVQGTGPAADTTEVAIQRRFNELRREFLQDRADTINWWLAATAIFLTLIGIVAPIAAYIGFNRLQGIEAEARQSVKQARRSAVEAEGHVEEARKNAVEAEGHVEEAKKNAVRSGGPC